MTTPVPLTKSEELLDELSRVDMTSSAMNEFVLAALKQRARAAIKTDPYHGYMALGAISALAWNDADLDAAHRNAIALDDNSLAHANYAVSLQLVNRRAEAAEQARIASDLEPENISLLARAIEYATVAGHIQNAMALYRKFVTRAPGTAPKFDTESIVRVLAMRGVPEAEFIQGQSILFEVLRQHRVRPDSVRIQTDEEPGDECVMITLVVEADYSFAQSLHDEACARLCEELPDSGHPDVMMFSICGNRVDELLSA